MAAATSIMKGLLVRSGVHLCNSGQQWYGGSWYPQPIQSIYTILNVVIDFYRMAHFTFYSFLADILLSHVIHYGIPTIMAHHSHIPDICYNLLSPFVLLVIHLTSPSFSFIPFLFSWTLTLQCQPICLPTLLPHCSITFHLIT